MLKEFKTADGSITYYNEEVQDHYHTKSGAIEEAFVKHAQALEVWNTESNPIRIIDMCFGLGYNAYAAIKEIKEHDSDKKIEVYCFENDIEILELAVKQDIEDEEFKSIKDFISNFLEYDKNTFEVDNVKLIMVYGDALETIRFYEEDFFDYCFFDPFSPSKVPHMWTVEFMADVYKTMKKGGKLSTYSYARKVRDNFAEVGFEVGKGPILGRWSPSTICTK